MFARRKGLFAETVLSVKEVLKQIQVLMDARQVLMESIQRFKTSITLAMHNQNLAIDRVDHLLNKLAAGCCCRNPIVRGCLNSGRRLTAAS